MNKKLKELLLDVYDNLQPGDLRDRVRAELVGEEIKPLGPLTRDFIAKSHVETIELTQEQKNGLTLGPKAAEAWSKMCVEEPEKETTRRSILKRTFGTQ